MGACAGGSRRGGKGVGGEQGGARSIVVVKDALPRLQIILNSRRQLELHRCGARLQSFQLFEGDKVIAPRCMLASRRMAQARLSNRMCKKRYGKGKIDKHGIKDNTH